MPYVYILPIRMQIHRTIGFACIHIHKYVYIYIYLYMICIISVYVCMYMIMSVPMLVHACVCS